MATDKRFVVKNGLQTENINFVFNDAVLGSSNITATMLSSNTLSFSGSTGQLFSITDSMTGTIFAVNDISGVPSIEVYDDGRIVLAETFGNVTIGNSTISSSRTSTSTTTGILQVAGGAGITGNINVGGTRSLFTGSVGIGTSAVLGANANVLSVYGTAMVFGNISLRNPAGGTSGVYFNDGTYQTTAFTSAATPSFGTIGTIQVAGAANTFTGDSTNFVFDVANDRLGIGTSTPTNVLSVWSTTTPAFFNTINSAVSSNNFEIIIGNSTVHGTTVGYVNNTLVPYGYLSAGTTTRNVVIAANGRVGIGGVTAPQVLLDVNGTTVIGASWAGNSNFINPPANGLAVQGSVGVGTYTPLNALDVRGGLGVTAASNFGGSLTVASLVSNGAVSGTTGTFSGAIFGSALNTSGTATVNALVSNGAISGTTITGTGATLTSSQNSGTETVNALISNVYGLFGQNVTVNSANASTTTGTGALVVAGGVGIGGRLNVGGASWFAGALNAGGAFIAQSINSNTNVVGVNLQSTGTATVNALISNGAVSGTTGTFGASLQSGAATVASLNSNTNVVAVNLQSTGTTTVSSLVSNGAISGATGTFTGAIFGSALNTSGTATVNALISNGAITGTTIAGTGLTVTSSQNSGTETVNALISNVYGLFGQNVTVNSTNASTSTTTGAFVLAGGAGIAGAVHVGGLIYGASTLNIAGAARVNSLISNGTVTATTYYGASDSAYYLQPDGFSQLQTTYFTTSNTNNGYVQVTEDYIFGADSGNANTFILSTAADSYVKSIFRFGIGTDTPLSKLDVRGGIGATAASNIGGALAVASLTSNAAITATTITGTALTVTSLQNSGLERAANIVSNTWIHATQNLTVASSNATTSTSTGALVVTGGVGIGSSLNVGWVLNTTSNTFVGGNLQVNGGQITTTQTGAAFIFDANVATLNIGRSATVVNMGSGASTVYMQGDLVVANKVISSFNGGSGSIFNTNVSALSIGGASTVTNIGNTGGIIYTPGDVSINGGDIFSTAATGTIFNSNVTTLSIGQAATTISIGANSGTMTIGNPTVVGTQATQNLYNTVATTMNFAGAATAISIGAATSTTTFNSTNTSISTSTGAIRLQGGAGIAGNIWAGGNIVLGSAAAVNQFWGNNNDSAVQPSFTWGSNTSSGMFLPNTSTVAFSTAGVERMRVDSAGNVGIATTTVQTGFTLQLQGNQSVSNRIGVGTIAIAGVVNTAAIFGTANIHGNIRLLTPTGGTAGVYFADGTYQTTAFTGAGTPSFGTVGTIQVAGAANAFTGDSTNFVFDVANDRLGIGTNAPTNVLSVWSTATPAWFNTINSAVSSNNFEILVGNSTVHGATLGYVNNATVPYGYLSAGTTTRNIIIAANGRVGLGGTTVPQNILDVNGAVAIGAAYAGARTAPANGLLVQGSVGIGTFTPTQPLDVRGNVYVEGTHNLFTNRVGVGTSSALGASANVFAVYGSTNQFGNVVISNTAAGGSGIYFPDGTFLRSAASTYSSFSYTGNGTTTSFSTSPITASSVNNTMVFVNGVYQRKSNYNWVGTDIIFGTAPPNNALIELVCVQALNNPLGVSDLTVSGNATVNGSYGLFSGRVGIGTSTILGTTSNTLSVYGTAVVYGNIDLGNPTGGTAGIYFADGTYQTTSGGGAFSIKTSNYTAVNGDKLLCDTSGGTFTVTLPASPTFGTTVLIYDRANFTTNPLNVARNGSTIEGVADDFILDIGQTKNEVVYDGVTWHIYVSIGPRGLSGSNAATTSSIAYSIALG